MLTVVLHAWHWMFILFVINTYNAYMIHTNKRHLVCIYIFLRLHLYTFFIIIYTRTLLFKCWENNGTGYFRVCVLSYLFAKYEMNNRSSERNNINSSIVVFSTPSEPSLKAYLRAKWKNEINNDRLNEHCYYRLEFSSTSR